MKRLNIAQNRRIYLDSAATTPIKPEVLRIMEQTFKDVYGNPGSLHHEGQEAIAVVDRARETIAKAVGAEFRGVVFTGSATEANNLVLRGSVKQSQVSNLKSQNGQKPRVIVSAIEHESVLETARDLQREGAELVVLPVNKEGIVDLKKLRESLNERTVIVSIMHVNNEIGTIQPIAEILKIIGELKKSIHSSSAHYPLFHTDAVQAFQYFPCSFSELGSDLMTISAHKMYGPKGVGALCINSKFKSQLLLPIVAGGGQEFGLRSGTENVPLIAGFAKAVELADKNREKEVKRISELKEYFWKGLKRIFPKAEINGPKDLKQAVRLSSLRAAPHILNVRFPGVSGEEFLIRLDILGIAISAGSACSMRSAKSSHVLEAIGLSLKQAKESLRFSFGSGTTRKEIDEVLSRIIAKI